MMKILIFQTPGFDALLCLSGIFLDPPMLIKRSDVFILEKLLRIDHPNAPLYEDKYHLHVA